VVVPPESFDRRCPELSPDGNSLAGGAQHEARDEPVAGEFAELAHRAHVGATDGRACLAVPAGGRFATVVSELLSPSAVRLGAVRGRYFRENFAQGGIDLVPMVRSW
jgi:hypothetical protein